MASFLENIVLGKAYIALEFFSIAEKEKIAYLKVSKKRNELAIAESGVLDTIDGLKAYKSNIPAVLVINNDKVIQKEMQDTDPSDRKLLHKAFPNLQVEEFYYEIWRNSEVSVVALCRKTYVNEQITKMQENFHVAAISLGSTAVSTLSGFALPAMLSTNTHLISFDGTGDLLTPDMPSAEHYMLNGLEINSSQLLGFSGALTFLMPSQTSGSIEGFNQDLRENYMQKTFFYKGLRVVITVLLGLLLINFFLFTHYFSKATEMSETVSTNKTSIENIAKLKKRIHEKEERFAALSDNAGSSSSLVLNDLVKDIPASILLTEIAYHPLEKKVKENEPIITRDSLISVSGITLSNVAFTQWVEKTGMSKWVANTTITSFGKDQDNNTNFSVNIILKK